MVIESIVVNVKVKRHSLPPDSGGHGTWNNAGRETPFRSFRVRRMVALFSSSRLSSKRKDRQDPMGDPVVMIHSSVYDLLERMRR